MIKVRKFKSVLLALIALIGIISLFYIFFSALISLFGFYIIGFYGLNTLMLCLAVIFDLRFKSHLKKYTLVFYGIMILLSSLSYIYYYSFAWFPPFIFYIIGFYIYASLLVCFAVLINLRFKIALRKYIMVLVGLFTLLFLLSIPIKQWQIEESEKTGDKIINAIEAYYTDNQQYPCIGPRISQT